MLGCGRQFDLDRCPIPNSRQVVAVGAESRSRDDAAQDFGWRSRSSLERNLTSYLQQVLSYFH
jgi:hypothetical protein